MDRKTKKQIDVLRTRLGKLQQQLAGAKQQCDDPEEVVKLQQAVSDTEAEFKRLKNTST
ncbi:MAG: hypothetical protein WEB58_07410 [Planctomycetaceae bacterium]